VTLLAAPNESNQGVAVDIENYNTQSNLFEVFEPQGLQVIPGC
jgi:hypothetical protein